MKSRLWILTKYFQKKTLRQRHWTLFSKYLSMRWFSDLLKDAGYTNDDGSTFMIIFLLLKYIFSISFCNKRISLIVEKFQMFSWTINPIARHLGKKGSITSLKRSCAPFTSTFGMNSFTKFEMSQPEQRSYVLLFRYKWHRNVC